MNDSIFVGLDVHKATVSVALAEGTRGGEVRSLGVVRNSPAWIRRWPARCPADRLAWQARAALLGTQDQERPRQGQKGRSAQGQASATRGHECAQRPEARSAARRFAERFKKQYPAAVACLRNDLDELLLPLQNHKTEAARRAVRTTDEMDKRFFTRAILYLSRATSWRSAAHRLKAQPGRLTRALPD